MRVYLVLNRRKKAKVKRNKNHLQMKVWEKKNMGIEKVKVNSGHAVGLRVASATTPSL